MKVIKKGLAAVVTMILTFGLLTGIAFADESGGSCGENVTWKLDGNGVLTISGSGAMEDYEGSNAPWFDRDIKKIVVENGVTHIGYAAFERTSEATEAEIADSVTSIGERAFAWCTSLEKVVIPKGMTEISDYSFAWCNALQSVSIPDSVKTIGSFAFYGAYQLPEVTIPEGVTFIGWHAFAYCQSMTRINLPRTLEHAGIGIVYQDPNYREEGVAYKPLELVCFCGTKSEWEAIEFEDEDDRHENAALLATPRIYHDYKDTVVPATPDKDGSITTNCAVCGAAGPKKVINKASQITLSDSSFVYNAKVQSPTVSVKDSKGKEISSKYYTIAYSNKKSKNAGKYTVTVNFRGNYSGSKKLKYSITKAPVSSVTKPKAKAPVYNGKAQKLVTAGKCKGGTVQYSLDKKTWSKKVPTGKNADKYKVYWKIVGDANHSNQSGGTITAKIAKANNTLTVKTSSKTYKSKELTKAATFKIGPSKYQGTLSFSMTATAKKAGIKVNGKGVVTVPKHCAPGKYVIKVTASGNKNYKSGTKKVTVNVKK